MASKSPQAFRTIREVADWLGVEAHVLRFWESKFNQIKPVKRAGGRRYYRPADMRLVGGIKVLLHDQGLTIRGVQKIIREDGLGHVSALSPALAEDLLDGEVIEAVATDATIIAPMEAPPHEAATGFFDIDAMASADSAGQDAPVSAEEVAQGEPVAAGARSNQAAEDAPEDTPEPVMADAPAPVPMLEAHPVAPDATEAPLSALHALVAESKPLNAARIAELAPHVHRLQALADRLTARSRAS
jgi:DNA-binding transcriptional MerR regulator